jgi:hypothetical protein
MLIMKAWLETRWRLVAGFTWLLICLAMSYPRHNSPGMNTHGMLLSLGTVLAFVSISLAGSGVKSQAPIGFPEGLVGSTQFTIALPVKRQRLLLIRTMVGVAEMLILTAFCAVTAWSLFPSVRAIAAPADFARLLVCAAMFQAMLYCGSLLFAAFLDEPLSLVYAGWTITFLVWLAHRISPAIDMLRIFGAESPLTTHRMPWSQLATPLALALILFMAAVRIVQAHEY